MRNALRTASVALLSITTALAGIAAAPGPVAATGEKVVIIVGPTGSITGSYRKWADEVAAAATSAGASVTKVYSPNATWDNVRTAVDGANVIVYFGHGNGSPNPYSPTEWTDRANGWGLNTATTNGDADSWSAGTLVYCGEKALLGTLTSSDGAAQRTYCSGGPITPAPGFVMIYAQAHYAPGFGERYVESDPITTRAEAQARVRNYSYPVLALGASSFLATAYGDADEIVSRVLTQRGTALGDIFKAGRGYASDKLITMAHPDVSGAEVWVQQTVISSFHFGDPDYWYAFAGDPSATFSGETVATVPRPQVTKVAPADGARWASTKVRPKAWFDTEVQGLTTSSFSMYDSYGFRVPGKVRWSSSMLRAAFVPSRQLVPVETYTARLTSAIKSPDGVSISPYSWSFRTKNDGDGIQVNWASTTRLIFGKGTHTGYRFDANGKVTSIRTGTLGADSGANAATRRLLPNQSGYWFYVTNGMWGGYWMRESDALQLAGTASVAAASGAPTAFDPSVRVAFQKGTHTGYKFSATGGLLAQKTYTLSRGSGANTDWMGAVPNQTGTWFRIVNGVWAGYWIRASDVVALE